MAETEIKKAKPADGYPPEEGCYLRGNDYSPVAVVSNPNIRFLIVCGPETPGHLVGDAILDLQTHGIDADKRIVGAKAPTPYLFNIPADYIDRFRAQITWRISDPQRQPKTEEQREKLEKAQALMERIRRSVEARKRGESEAASGQRESQS